MEYPPFILQKGNFDENAKPQTLTAEETVLAKKARVLVNCMNNAEAIVTIKALTGEYSSKEDVQKDFDAAVKTCETDSGTTADEVNSFSEMLIKKYGKDEAQ